MSKALCLIAYVISFDPLEGCFANILQKKLRLIEVNAFSPVTGNSKR